MSVLIKGMKMPKMCAKFEDGEFVHCPFVNTDDDCVLQDKITDTWEEMYRNCPLIELPEKHGRLIDADAFSDFIADTIKRQEYENLKIDGLLTVADVLAAVVSDLTGTGLDRLNNAPTIIEAEGDEEWKE